MFYLESPSTDPQFNLALEEHVFENMDRAHAYFMLWRNDNAIIVGRYQNTAREVNRPFVEQNDIRVVRRLSGGGAVYHDLGNLNFTYVMDAGESIHLDFSLFCQPIADALRAFGVEARVGGRNDITVDGKKFSGNAQYRKRGRVMHHGTIMFDSNLETVAKALQVSPDKFQDKGISSVRSRVTNLKDHIKADIGIEEFKRTLAESMFRRTALAARPFSQDDLAAAERIRRDRYARWDWNWGASPGYSIEKSRRIQGVGEITLYMEIEKGIITAYRSHGDFFSSRDPAEFERLILGCPAERERLLAFARELPLDLYYNNLGPEDFVSLVLE